MRTIDDEATTELWRKEFEVAEANLQLRLTGIDDDETTAQWSKEFEVAKHVSWLEFERFKVTKPSRAWAEFSRMVDGLAR